jgi:hypothetical protein
MGIEVDEEVPEKVALSARVSPCEVLNRLRHLRDYAHIKAHSKRITTEMAVEALKMLSPGQVTQELPREKQSKTFFLPNTAFIMMWMDKSHAELDDVSNAIKEVFGEFGINAVRADDVEHQDKITDLVLNHIRESEFLVADLEKGQTFIMKLGTRTRSGKGPSCIEKRGLNFTLTSPFIMSLTTEISPTSKTFFARGSKH